MVSSIQVFIPTFNRCHSLVEAIKSVQAQSFSDFEIVVLDNCSTDETPKQIKILSSLDKRIKYIRRDINIGMIGNFNSIKTLIKSPFFCVLTDDDLYKPNFFNDAMDLLEKFEKADAAIFNALTRRDDVIIGSQLSKWDEGFFEKGRALPYVLSGFHPIITNCLFRNSIKHLFHFIDDLRGSADIYFLVTLVAEHSVVVSKVTSGYYNITGTNESVLVDGIERIYQRIALKQYVSKYLGGKNDCVPYPSLMEALIMIIRYSSPKSITEELYTNRISYKYGIIFKLFLIMLSKKIIQLPAKHLIQILGTLKFNFIKFFSSKNFSNKK